MPVYPRAGLRGPQEAVMHVVCVDPLSGDYPKHVGGRRLGALVRARSDSRHVELSDAAPRSPHEAVICAVRVDPHSSNQAQKIDAFRYGALTRAGARARNVEFGDLAGTGSGRSRDSRCSNQCSFPRRRPGR